MSRQAEIFWATWVLAGVIYEIYALITNVHKTLSYQIWGLEGTGLTAMRFFVGAFLLWLFLHLVFHIFT